MCVLSKKGRVKELPLEEFPTMDEVDELLESFLRNIYEDDFEKFVLKQDKGHYLIVSKGYRLYPPIIIATIGHPDGDDKALFVNIERSFPIANELELIWISNALGENFNIKYEEIERVYREGSEEKKYTLRYVTVTTRLHSLSIKDSSWFYLTLSRILKIDNLILGVMNNDKYNSLRLNKKEEKNYMDYT